MVGRSVIFSRTKLSGSVAGAAFAALAALILLPDPAAAASGDIQAAMNPSRKGDLVKTIPISRRPWQKARVVQSLGPGKIGPIKEGKVLESSGDLQLTICIRPHPNHPGQPCVGKYHSFDPKVRVKMVLGKTKRATGGARAIAVSKTRSFECTERRGHRNRHCVQQVPWSRQPIDARIAQHCASGCYLNLVVSVYHRRARKGHQVVVGSSNEQKKITQRRSQIAAALHPGADTASVNRWRTRNRLNRKPPVVAKGRNFKERVVYSQRLNASAGDVFLVEARPIVSNTHLPYPTHQHYSIVLSRDRTGTDHNNKIAERIGPPGVSNGFTCTRNSSGHSSPCAVTKTGVVTVRGGGNFFVNVVVGQEARGDSTEYKRWRSSHKTRMLKRGYLEVRKYHGAMSCTTCRLWRGFQTLTTSNPSGNRAVGDLVRKLDSHRIPQARYHCYGRRGSPDLVCEWRADGRMGVDPYSCSMVAKHNRGGAWILTLCREALAADLADRLRNRGDLPGFTGGCGPISNNRYRCGWNANQGTPLRCNGDAIYHVGEQRWTIDACRP